MALFTDGNICTTEDLRQYESSILDVASTEGIELGAKLKLAQREIGVAITAFLLEHETGSRYARDLSSVVVTDALQQWLSLQSLALIYRDVYNVQNNDRYLGKWKEYERLADSASVLFFQVGVGITLDPVAQSGLPDCGSAGGGTLPLGTYYVSTAWQSALGNIGGPSEALPVTTNPGTLLTVRAVRPPVNAVGWFVYAGQSEDEIRRQNATALAIGDTWTLPVSGLGAGLDGTAGQAPDFYVTRNSALRRG
ncbi:MAG: hypothetical protein ABJF23_21140 [Bryobacteraceae bacterium]